MVRRKWGFLIFCLGALGVAALSGCAARDAEVSLASSTRVENLKVMGDVHLREGRYRAAMQQYVEADRLGPNNAELKLLIGMIYSDYYKRLDEAIPYYQEAIRLKKDYSEAYNNLGTIYLRQSKWDEAISMFQKAIGNIYYSTPEMAYYNMAAAYLGKGDYNKAIEYYRTVMELKPQNEDAYIHAGLIYEEQGQNAQALQSFQRARSILEKREPKKGKSSEAEWEAYRSALAGVCYHQGAAFAKLRRFAEAREAYQKALEMAPEGEVQKRIQQELQSLP